jgi:hypothetical protein
MEIVSTSPSKRFELRVDVYEARNSLWVHSPSIWDADQECRVFVFDHEAWSVESNVWLGETIVRLLLRKFPGNHYPDHLWAEIDCVALTAVVLANAAFPPTSTPLIYLEKTLNQALVWR